VISQEFRNIATNLETRRRSTVTIKSRYSVHITSFNSLEIDFDWKQYESKQQRWTLKIEGKESLKTESRSCSIKINWKAKEANDVQQKDVRASCNRYIETGQETNRWWWWGGGGGGGGVVILHSRLFLVCQMFTSQDAIYIAPAEGVPGINVSLLCMLYKQIRVITAKSS